MMTESKIREYRTLLYAAIINWNNDYFFSIQNQLRLIQIQTLDTILGEPHVEWTSYKDIT